MIGMMPWPLCPLGECLWDSMDRRLVGPRAFLDAVVKRKIPLTLD